MAQRLSVKSWPQCFTSALARFQGGFFFTGAIFLAIHSSAQFSPPADSMVAHSVSGQFVVNASSQFSPLFNLKNLAADTNLIRLDPAVLAVSAERFKSLIWQQLGLKANSPWRGKIFLILQPAVSLDDNVTIASGPIFAAWDYRVILPDVVARTRCARALSAVILMEIANRNNPAKGHGAEIPSWLADGLAQAALDEDTAKVILSTPDKTVNELLQSSVNEKTHVLDPLSSARATLQNSLSLTFDQMSWPTDAQVNGDDGGVYLASAQLFVHELLGLKNGPEKMCDFLARLTGSLNWQTAFYAAFHDDFQWPLQVEKWWSLRAVNFSAHNANSQWTLADSNDALAKLLSVPVEIRDSSNALPTHAEVSLQAAIRNFTTEQRGIILGAKLRELELAQYHLAPPFAALNAGYRAALADFIGERKKIPVAQSTRFVNRSQLTGTIRSSNLDELKRQATDYHTALAQYVQQLKNNPQMGIVKNPQNPTAAPAPTPVPATKKPKIIQSPVTDFTADAENYSSPAAGGKHPLTTMRRLASEKDTLKKLDELDVQRRELIARLNLETRSQNVATSRP